MLNINIYFDEKGPTKTIRGNLNPGQPKFNFYSKSSDNVPAYCGVFVVVPKKNQKSFDTDYQRIEQNYLKNHNNKQMKEIKGKNIFKSKNFPLNEIRDSEAIFFNQILNLLEINDCLVQLSIFDKSQVLIVDRLSEWLFLLENSNFFKNKSRGISVNLVLYVLTKFIHNEDKNKMALDSLLNESLTTYQILRRIKGEMIDFIQENKNNKKMKRQLSSYKEIIKFINNSGNLNKKTSCSFQFPVNQIAYGLELWLSEIDDSSDFSYVSLFLDEDAPKVGYVDINANNIHENCRSQEFQGIRAADLLASLFGKLLSSFEKNSEYDKGEPQKIKKLPKNFFKKLSVEQEKLVANLNRLLIETPYNFSIVHSEYADYLFTMLSWFELSTEYDHFDSENHLYLTLSKMDQYFIQMGTQGNLVRAAGFSNTKEAIESKLLKPF